MKKNKLNQYEAQTSLEPSPEQIQQAKEWAVNRMMEVVDRLPANIQPVAESFAELIEQAKSGVGIPKNVTKIISGGSLEVPKNVTKTIIEAPKNVTSNILTDLDLEVLRKIQNGES
jgi:hypothetical protein